MDNLKTAFFTACLDVLEKGAKDILSPLGGRIWFKIMNNMGAIYEPIVFNGREVGRLLMPADAEIFTVEVEIRECGEGGEEATQYASLEDAIEGALSQVGDGWHALILVNDEPVADINAGI